MEYSAYQKTAISCAKEAGEVIKAAWDNLRHVVNKGEVDLVTETDQRCEKLIFDRLRQEFPSHKLIGEEDSAARGSIAPLTDEPTWLIDPLDGTTNFVHKFPFVCVCIGLAVKKQVVVGVVYNPILDELFDAVRGQGTRHNGKSIHVSSTQALGKALVATEIGTTRDQGTVDAIFDRITATVKGCRSLRCTGSCALNLAGVAMGRLDAFFEVGFGGPWDVAAASLLVEEAGGLVLDPSGRPFDLTNRRVLGGTPAVATQLAGLLKDCMTSTAEPAPPS